jgi:DNA-binding HxlR family transcriptional regulator
MNAANMRPVTAEPHPAAEPQAAAEQAEPQAAAEQAEPQAADPCRASEVLGRVGDKWSLQVIFCLGEGTRRFTDLKRGVDGISQRMLTVTLRGLERDGIVTRTMYPVMPPRVEYALTPMGDTLRDAVGTLIGWAHAHLDEIEAARAAYDAREQHSGRAFTA